MACDKGKDALIQVVAEEAVMNTSVEDDMEE